MTQYANFRQRLDAVLRTLDVHKVSEFLIAEKQWQPGQPANPEFAMWMMIAGSPTLSDLHAQARTWLMSHGYEEEAKAVLNRGGKSKQGGKQVGRSGARPGNPAGSRPRSQFPKGKK